MLPCWHEFADNDLSLGNRLKLLLILNTDLGEVYKGEPYNLSVRIYRVFEKNEILAREIVRRVDSMPFLDSLAERVRTDITDDPGFWEL